MIVKKLFLILPPLILITAFSFSEEGSFVYDAQNRRDPFLALVSPDGYILNLGFEIESSDLKVEGIIYDPHSESLAIVNGKVVKSGDFIGSFKIKQIEKDAVTFLSDDEEVITIKLKKEE